MCVRLACGRRAQAPPDTAGTADTRDSRVTTVDMPPIPPGSGHDTRSQNDDHSPALRHTAAAQHAHHSPHCEPQPPHSHTPTRLSRNRALPSAVKPTTSVQLNIMSGEHSTYSSRLAATLDLNCCCGVESMERTWNGLSGTLSSLAQFGVCEY